MNWFSKFDEELLPVKGHLYSHLYGENTTKKCNRAEVVWLYGIV